MKEDIMFDLLSVIKVEGKVDSLVGMFKEVVVNCDNSVIVVPCREFSLPCCLFNPRLDALVFTYTLFN